MNIFVVNSGSSSIKYQFFRMPEPQPVCVGLIERIGEETGSITHTVFGQGEKQVVELEMGFADHEAGLRYAVGLLTGKPHGVIADPADIAIVGHRVVHGGENYREATIINTKVKDDIRRLFYLAPLHNPPGLKGIEVAEKIFKNATQVAVFDTAFHQTMPEQSFRYAIPQRLYTENGVRVYGFHGTSHKYVTGRALQYLGNKAAKLVSIHLGNGCSITAVSEGRSVDTSMGFGPLSGLVMGTRGGDLDPSVILYLVNELDFNLGEVSAMLNRESGLLGLSGYSDMRDVAKACDSGDANAGLALDIYALRVRKYIGAYAAVLNGLDALVFTAGVGENDGNMRERICTGMEFFNIGIDKEKNRQKVAGIHDISLPGATVKILVVPTNEELEIAQQCFGLFSGEV